MSAATTHPCPFPHCPTKGRTKEDLDFHLQWGHMIRNEDDRRELLSKNVVMADSEKHL